MRALDIHGLPVDIGNTWAGLDARLRPFKVRVIVAGILVLETRSNQEAASYVGDLGRVVANYAPIVTRFLWQKLDKPNPEFQKVYNDFASQEDLLGDIDSYSVPLDAPGGGRKRCSTFMAHVKLLLPATSEAFNKEVFVASQCVLAGDKKIPALLELYEQPDVSLDRPRAVIFSEVIKVMLDAFTSWCQKRARSE
ncbi:hypothetical protein [Hyalangium gracile]|uniref:hypothetical protein n=1 Tax=Hyalangium gracile TaxID=394092 RepID=UPI001CCF79A9|nr:hypothetical protein [Hyalangium gracile]